MKKEYDFKKMKGGVRGKYYKAYRAGHIVTIHKTNGSTSAQHFKLVDGAVMLEPDLRKYFPNSKAVNKALRGLVALLPKQRQTKAKS
jgi:hypothetical protein